MRRVLVIGSGGREHAIAWKLTQDSEVFCAPGNPGIAADCQTFDVDQADHTALVDLALSLEVDLVVVGPENPLIDGLADELRAAHLSTFGPGKTLAQFEGDKAWSKEQMMQAGVPTAAYAKFNEFNAARDYAMSRFAVGKGVAIKATGAAFGKGVVVCDSVEHAAEALEMMMVRKDLGSAGDTVVVEDRLYGKEFSLLTIVSGRSFRSLPVAQDYKRAHDGDQGENTGGMGSYSPVPWVTDSLVKEAEDQIVRPMVNHLADRGHDYRGVLFSGIMVEDGKPLCLEYNVRFGDPEIQSVVMRLGGGLGDALSAVAAGEDVPEWQVIGNSATTIVVASGGYPAAYKKGLVMTLGKVPDNVKVFHSGTRMQDGALVTNGGRVAAVTAVSFNAETSRKQAYEAVPAVQFDGAFFRSDIGQ